MSTSVPFDAKERAEDQVEVIAAQMFAEFGGAAGMPVHFTAVLWARRFFIKKIWFERQNLPNDATMHCVRQAGHLAAIFARRAGKTRIMESHFKEAVYIISGEAKSMRGDDQIIEGSGC